jgi:hypothetical protein
MAQAWRPGWAPVWRLGLGAEDVAVVGRIERIRTGRLRRPSGCRSGRRSGRRFGRGGRRLGHARRRRGGTGHLNRGRLNRARGGAHNTAGAGRMECNCAAALAGIEEGLRHHAGIFSARIQQAAAAARRAGIDPHFQAGGDVLRQASAHRRKPKTGRKTQKGRGTHTTTAQEGARPQPSGYLTLCNYYPNAAHFRHLPHLSGTRACPPPDIVPHALARAGDESP